MTAVTSPTPVVLCADDYACSAPVSQAIVQLARQQRLSATSAMVLSPRWPDDAAALRALRGQIDVGLHLDWTSDFARDQGHGMGLAAAMARAVLGGFGRAAARRVIDRQLDAFEAHWGAPPDHVDGHQHVQQFAGIREALVEALAQRYGAPGQRLPWLRISRAPAGWRDAKSRTIAALGAGALERLAAAHGLATAPCLMGVYAFDGGRAAYAQRLRAWLDAAPPGALLMCHPATAAEPGDVIGPARVWEHDVLHAAQGLPSASVQLARGSTLYTAPLA